MSLWRGWHWRARPCCDVAAVLETVAAALSALDRRLNSMEGKLASIHDLVGTIGTSVAAIASDVSDVSGKVSTVLANLQAGNTSQADIDALTAAASGLAKADTDLKAVSASIDTALVGPAPQPPAPAPAPGA